jgi:hypothetical protein
MGHRSDLIRFATVAFAVVASATACSSASEQSASTSTSATASAAAAATTATGTEVLQKQLGEKAFVGCTDSSNDSCDLAFTVTNLRQGAQCAPRISKPPLKPDEQLIGWDIEYWTGPQLNYPALGDLLFLGNWGIGNSEGVDNELEAYFSDDCAEQISKSLLPGTHVKKSIVVIGPKDATTLKLFLGAKGGGWEWKIPPATGR